jgi:hypothetical protein
MKRRAVTSQRCFGGWGVACGVDLGDQRLNSPSEESAPLRQNVEEDKQIFLSLLRGQEMAALQFRRAHHPSKALRCLISLHITVTIGTNDCQQITHISIKLRR